MTCDAAQPAQTRPRARRAVRFLARWAPDPAVILRSDEAVVELGQGLSPDELRYVHALLAHALAGEAE